MNRSKKIIVVSHCILNANAKVSPLAVYPGVLKEVIQPFIDDGAGVFQLPCPESSYLGINRWGMCFEQYNTPGFRRHCRKILAPVMDQIAAFAAQGYEIIGVIGADGSPNCGVNKIPTGFEGGVMGHGEPVEEQLAKLRFQPGTGVFFTILEEMLQHIGVAAKFMAVDEDNPSELVLQNKGVKNV